VRSNPPITRRHALRERFRQRPALGKRKREMRLGVFVSVWLLLLLSLPSWAAAAGEGAFHVPYWTAAPFVLLLFAIAVLPLFAGHFWESNRRKGVVVLFFSAPLSAICSIAMRTQRAGPSPPSGMSRASMFRSSCCSRRYIQCRAASCSRATFKPSRRPTSRSSRWGGSSPT
jgi:hypothetical protein